MIPQETAKRIAYMKIDYFQFLKIIAFILTDKSVLSNYLLVTRLSSSFWKLYMPKHNNSSLEAIICNSKIRLEERKEGRVTEKEGKKEEEKKKEGKGRNKHDLKENLPSDSVWLGR